MRDGRWLRTLAGALCVVQVEEMLADVPVDANGNFKYQEFVKQFRSDA